MGRLEFSPDDAGVVRSTEPEFDGPPPPAYDEVAHSKYSGPSHPGPSFPMPASAHYSSIPGGPGHMDPFPLASPPSPAQNPQFTQRVPPAEQTSFSPRLGHDPQGWGQTQSAVYRSSSTATSASGPHTGLNYAPSVRSTNRPLSPSTSSMSSPMSPSLSDTASLASSSDAQLKDSEVASGKVLARLLSPPPPCFSRTLPPELPYGPFAPSALLGTSSRLEAGFPELPPPSSAIPHPFVTHDVGEEDWMLFLRHVKAVANDTPVMGKFATEIAPRAMAFGFLGALAMTKGMEVAVKGKKKGPVAQLIAQWNHYFFHPRQIDVVLAQGRICYTGGDEIPPDMLRRSKSSKKVAQAQIADDSDSDSERRHDEELSKKSRRMTQNTHRNLWEFNQDYRDAVKQVWRLVVSHKPYIL
ncbi:hypothetical protein OBBRIDRAFT_745604 [Obba rivulosa]|uniref:Uncharacterized protein n=1 Tax=Obba rivulosa TaxID=1052685 RepID=A0A8E2J5U0_9APHY|nr:hypothetical protein OBBRIDRAFT_745604 [Obba rivulosa]